MTAAKKIKIRYAHSIIGCTEAQRATLRALGLRKIGQKVERIDTAAIRGMVRKIPHLVVVEE